MTGTTLYQYRALRTVANAHNGAGLELVSRKTFLENARTIGLAHGDVLTLESEDELTMVYDLCLHTARPGRSRAIDRFAHATSFAAGSDEALVLAAMQQARFSIWQVMEYHHEGGLVVCDRLRGGEAWLMDEAMTASCKPDFQFAGRLFMPGDFAMSTGVLVPFDVKLAAALEGRMTPALNTMTLPAMAGDYRFAQAIYRAAVATNAMAGVGFAEAPMAA
jgi:hypothetical protein